MSILTAATPTREQVERVVRSILLDQMGNGLGAAASANGKAGQAVGGYRPHVVVNISARHCHLTQADLEVLYGPGYQLTEMKRLYQATDFASNETVAVVGPRQRMIPGVRILGPCRNFSQVELSFTDAISLGIDLPVRLSGDIEGTPGCLLMVSLRRQGCAWTRNRLRRTWSSLIVPSPDWGRPRYSHAGVRQASSPARAVRNPSGLSPTATF